MTMWQDVHEYFQEILTYQSLEEAQWNIVRHETK